MRAYLETRRLLKRSALIVEGRLGGIMQLPIACDLLGRMITAGQLSRQDEDVARLWGHCTEG